MNTYSYEISGEYKDWWQIRKNNTILHNGSLVGLIKSNHNELELTLNFNTKENHALEIKMFCNLFLAIPKESECLSGNNLYVPLIYTEKEFNELIDISYIDRSLVRNIALATKEDIIKAWLFTFNNRFACSSYTELKTNILNSIIAFSNHDEDIYKFLDFNIFKNQNIYIVTINEKSELITVYLGIQSTTYEWNSIIKVKENFYLKIDDVYGISFE